jgi:hypothetical protein
MPEVYRMIDETKIKAKIREIGIRETVDKTGIDYSQLCQYIGGFRKFSVERLLRMQRKLEVEE